MNVKPAMIVEDHQRLARLIFTQRSAGKTVVFANGGFDLLHVGHLRYLQAAAREGDLLMVAVNDDESIRQSRGPGRPVVPLTERMELVAALRCVDYVTSFHSPTVDGLLELVRPHVHAKGRDWTLERLPEAETVKRLGIRFASVGDPKDHSSTAIWEQIRSKGT
jgi:rfaE bifunctional protein nucleotidyltransferase chain/domain